MNLFGLSNIKRTESFESALPIRATCQCGQLEPGFEPKTWLFMQTLALLRPADVCCNDTLHACAATWIKNGVEVSKCARAGLLCLGWRGRKRLRYNDQSFVVDY